MGRYRYRAYESLFLATPATHRIIAPEMAGLRHHALRPGVTLLGIGSEAVASVIGITGGKARS